MLLGDVSIGCHCLHSLYRKSHSHRLTLPIITRSLILSSSLLWSTLTGSPGLLPHFPIHKFCHFQHVVDPQLLVCNSFPWIFWNQQTKEKIITEDFKIPCIITWEFDTIYVLFTFDMLFLLSVLPQRWMAMTKQLLPLPIQVVFLWVLILLLSLSCINYCKYILFIIHL